MSKPAKRSPERKLKVVLSVLCDEVSVAEVARRAGVAEPTVHNWKNAFLEAGRAGLVPRSGQLRVCNDIGLILEAHPASSSLSPLNRHGGCQTRLPNSQLSAAEPERCRQTAALCTANAAARDTLNGYLKRRGSWCR